MCSNEGLNNDKNNDYIFYIIERLICMMFFTYFFVTVIRARQEQLERQAEIQRKKEEEVQQKLEEKNKLLSASSSATSSWRNLDKTKEEPKLFNRDKDTRREFARNRDDGPPTPSRPNIFGRGNDDRKGGTFNSWDNERSGWARGGSGTSGGAFDKGFKDGPREGGRIFDRDTPRKRDIPSSNDQVSFDFFFSHYYFIMCV